MKLSSKTTIAINIKCVTNAFAKVTAAIFLVALFSSHIFSYAQVKCPEENLNLLEIHSVLHPTAYFSPDQIYFVNFIIVVCAKCKVPLG